MNYGKISIPDAILNKSGKLDEDEWEIMKTHTLNGYQILRTADRYSNIAECAMSHHERIDGKGYPNSIGGKDITLFFLEKLLWQMYIRPTVPESIAKGSSDFRVNKIQRNTIRCRDSECLNRQVMSYEELLVEIQKGSGVHFDSEVLKLL